MSFPGERRYVFPRPYILNGVAILVWACLASYFSALFADNAALRYALMGAVFLAANAILGLRMLLDEPLEIDAVGFSFKALLWRREYRWGEVTPFQVVWHRNSVGIGFDLAAAAYVQQSAWSSRRVPNLNLPLAIVGVRLHDAANTLNAYRDKAVKRLYDERPA